VRSGGISLSDGD